MYNPGPSAGERPAGGAAPDPAGLFTLHQGDLDETAKAQVILLLDVMIFFRLCSGVERQVTQKVISVLVFFFF